MRILVSKLGSQCLREASIPAQSSKGEKTNTCAILFGLLGSFRFARHMRWIAVVSEHVVRVKHTESHRGMSIASLRIRTDAMTATLESVVLNSSKIASRCALPVLAVIVPADISKPW